MLRSLLNIDRASRIGLSEQIYRQIRIAVRDQILNEGYKLPSSRGLSADLKVSRNTVSDAYERLKAEQIITVRPGAAAVITNGLSVKGLDKKRTEPAPSAAKLSVRGEALCQNARAASRTVSGGLLEAGVPALDLFPRDSWARSLRRSARGLKERDVLYQNVAGLPTLRTELAIMLGQTRGVSTTAENILICTSTQAALSLLSACLADNGDTALLEEPGYLGARGAFENHGLRTETMSVDKEGATLPTRLTKTTPRLIYLTPSHQYPLGVSMSLSRRLSVIAYARRTGAVILEDDYDSEFLFSGKPVASLHGLASGSEVIYLGTFAKSMLPGLRVAYMAVPAHLVSTLSQAIRNTGIMASAHIQAGLADFIQTGQYHTHLRKIRSAYAYRGNELYTALKSALGDKVEILPPTGGVQLVMKFRKHRDDVGLAQKLQSQGVGASPLSKTYIKAGDSGLILGFSNATSETIKTAIPMIRKLL